jgi:hypothetical protein
VLQGVQSVVTEMSYGAARRDDTDNTAGFFHNSFTLQVRVS